MPNLDKTGPTGAGPSTGRGRGPCGAGAGGPGRGFGQGRGQGFGQGRGQGFGRGQRGVCPFPAPGSTSPEQEKGILTDEVKFLEERLAATKERLQELE
ncbi:MAG: DUF5320 domain-containing protein [Patescibacteria group bacterium]|nr:DUF5320 domain-containing protein [Patescibacteria group bacterium]